MLNRRMVWAGLAAALALALPLAALDAAKPAPKADTPGVIKPQLISKTEPKYTPEAKEAKIQGPVVLDAEIEADGTVGNVKLKKSLDPGLDKNAIEAIRQWKFKPAEKDGKPIKVLTSIEVNFRLD